MKQELWQRAYAPDPAALETCVKRALARLDTGRAARTHTLRTVLLAALLLSLLGGIALAALESRTAQLAGWLAGQDREEALLTGDIALSGSSTRLGDVVYTLDDVIYKDGMVYGSGTMQAAEGANIVLMAEDTGVHEPAGYPLHYGKEYTVPDDAPSYAELAEARGARIILAKCVADGVLDAQGALDASEIGYAQVPQPDGSIRFYFEFAGAQGGIDRAQSYDVQLSLANWEVTPEGKWLREEPENTWLQKEWVVTVTPEAKGEAE